MTKIDIISGFLGAGKTTLIKKLIGEAYKNEKVVLIENEFGEIGIDGGFLKEAGIEITEMNSGCICCSLVGDFTEALKKVLEDFAPDRIIIEPSGVGKLSDVIGAVKEIECDSAKLNGFTTVVDAKKAKMYIKNFGEFFIDQVENASAIVLSHTGNLNDEKLENCVHLLREHNEKAVIVTTDWDKLSGEQLLEAIENKNTLQDLKEDLEHEHCHHHHHHEEGEECSCGHHHHEHHHHHHEDGEECSCGHHHHEHHHHHEEGEECSCGHHHHDHHHHHEDGEECSCGHHHHADDVFTSIGKETTKKFTAQELNDILAKLDCEETYGIVLRAKGIVEGADGNWLHFDYVPGEPDVRNGGADIIGRICVIGSKINEQALLELFGIGR